MSEGYKQGIEAPKTDSFWKQEQITESQFLEKADTFDVLLFTCNTSGGKLIRGYTNCDYGKSFTSS